MPDRPALTLAHSADADDVFMWWPITGKVDPADPARVLQPPRIDTGRFTFRSLPEDIQRLNRRAIEVGDLDITALSFASYAHVAGRYVTTACGSSFGINFGPKLVCRAAEAITIADLTAGRVSPRIAVPGLQTSAFLVLSMLLGKTQFHPLPLPFDQIAAAVTSGQADLGLLIHEAQITYAQQGLKLVADLGEWWGGQTSLPMPLGCNAVRRDLDARFGSGTLAEVAHTLRRSLDFARAHRVESLEYAKTFSPLKSDNELERYINMYVNEYTVEARPKGQEAVNRLLAEGHRLGISPAVHNFAMLGHEQHAAHQ